MISAISKRSYEKDFPFNGSIDIPVCDFQWREIGLFYSRLVEYFEVYNLRKVLNLPKVFLFNGSTDIPVCAMD
ncbi:MAG TPA: hypothetical protein PLU67_03180 [Candidatus Kapabacteria bacterium]|nr:hypothetical protein [Candidatus Kapabacteria bacterium]HPP38913.1 hypothetical protein [Candidatus Kapabacteria bacterium]